MKLVPIILIFISFFMLISCKTSIEPANSNSPYGIWIYSKTTDSVHVYYSANKFEEDKPGLAFKKDNIFVERASGWCATPPLSYSNIKGKWEYISENEFKITTSNWISEEYTRTMKIVSLSGDDLKVIINF